MCAYFLEICHTDARLIQLIGRQVAQLESRMPVEMDDRLSWRLCQSASCILMACSSTPHPDWTPFLANSASILWMPWSAGWQWLYSECLLTRTRHSVGYTLVVLLVSGNYLHAVQIAIGFVIAHNHCGSGFLDFPTPRRVKGHPPDFFSSRMG
jgi:hypothetical protein